MRNQGTEWTPQQLVFLRKNFATLSKERLVESLGRGWEGIRSKAAHNGIRRPRPRAQILFFASGKPKYRKLKNGCWKWIAAVNKKGYPITRGGANTTLAHRQLYIDVHGAIPDDIDVDHTCRFRRCVNIEHLDAVTHQINIQRGGGRTKLTLSQVTKIRADKTSSYHFLAEKYGVRPGTIWFIRSGKTWV
jgi:hypothetical protein